MKKKDYILQKKAYVSPGIKVIDVDTEQLMNASGDGPDQPYVPGEGDGPWGGQGQKGVFFDDSWDDEEGYGFDYSY